MSSSSEVCTAFLGSTAREMQSCKTWTIHSVDEIIKMMEMDDLSRLTQEMGRMRLRKLAFDVIMREVMKLNRHSSLLIRCSNLNLGFQQMQLPL